MYRVIITTESGRIAMSFHMAEWAANFVNASVESLDLVDYTIYDTDGIEMNLEQLEVLVIEE
jgi:hypothetical protein